MPRPGYASTNLPPELVEQVDAVRGDQSRDAFCHEAIKREITRRKRKA